MLAGIFGVRAGNQLIHWVHPSHQDQPLAGWMTPRYVGQSYRVPPEVVKSAFEMDMNSPPHRISLDRLAAENGMSMDEMQSALDTAVAAWRAASARTGQ
ncbi:hypothetical protein [Yoonia sp.]|uniref:hypothetical protein n=1 Tax=Yoonia sp. TaxID=2212373 RepID=UPI0035C8366C